MNVDSFEALVVIVVFVLPGALYEWQFERVVGGWNVGLSDRILRFVGSSAFLHAIAFPVTFTLWRDHLRGGQLQAASSVPWDLWAAMILAVAVPTALGGLVGWATKLDQRWARLMVGSAPAPQAWDHLFYRGVRGVVRAKLKSGPFVAGQFVDDPADPAKRSYAAGFPNEPDLFLIHQVVVDPESGEFAADDDGNLVRAGSGLLVTKNQIEHLEFFPESDPGGS